MRILYTFCLALLLPVMLARLFWRGMKQHGYRDHIGERFGRYSQPSLKRCIWIHAVSVGEARAAQPLIVKLTVRYPALPILLTCMTPTGRATALELFGDAVTTCYLPYDLVALHQRLLDYFQPSILLILETEIWPNLLHTCKKNTVPALLVNARLSERSWRAYMRFAPVRKLARQALQSMQVVGAQSDKDAERLRLLGAPKTTVTGNIKFDVERTPALMKLGENWRSAFGSRRVLLFASTREGEEALLLAAYLQYFDADARRDTLLVIVPRHPQRFDSVAGQINACGLRFTRRNQGIAENVVHCNDVLLGDSMGEMAAYYSLCDVAIVGGSFLPLGGQNPIEACALGKPVIMGPSTFNFAEVVRLARDAGAMKQVGDAMEALRIAHDLLHDNEWQKRMSDAGRNLIEANRGATEKTLALIAPLMGTE